MSSAQLNFSSEQGPFTHAIFTSSLRFGRDSRGDIIAISRRYQNNVQNKYWTSQRGKNISHATRRTILFLPRFVVTCALPECTRKATWNLFVD